MSELKTASEWALFMGELRNSKPRPLAKWYGARGVALRRPHRVAAVTYQKPHRYPAAPSHVGGVALTGGGARQGPASVGGLAGAGAVDGELGGGDVAAAGHGKLGDGNLGATAAVFM